MRFFTHVMFFGGLLILWRVTTIMAPGVFAVDPLGGIIGFSMVITGAFLAGVRAAGIEIPIKQRRPR